MTQEEYLEAEFRRYFPAADNIDVLPDEDETITVKVYTPEGTSWDFFMEIGSDDDWYEFLDPTGVILTIPLQADHGN